MDQTEFGVRVPYQPQVYEREDSRTLIQPTSIVLPPSALALALEEQNNLTGSNRRRKRNVIDGNETTSSPTQLPSLQDSVRVVFLLHRTSILFPSEETTSWVSWAKLLIKMTCRFRSHAEGLKRFCDLLLRLLCHK